MRNDKSKQDGIQRESWGQSHVIAVLPGLEHILAGIDQQNDMVVRRLDVPPLIVILQLLIEQITVIIVVRIRHPVPVLQNVDSLSRCTRLYVAREGAYGKRAT